MAGRLLWAAPRRAAALCANGSGNQDDFTQICLHLGLPLSLYPAERCDRVLPVYDDASFLAHEASGCALERGGEALCVGAECFHRGLEGDVFDGHCDPDMACRRIAEALSWHHRDFMCIE